MSHDARSAREVFWAYAASFGAIWGAIEATLGSFLHAIKLPFSGVLLASAGAALLLALRALYPRPGVIVATGMVCAAIKLSSPATVLLGPAIGILTESVLVELTCLLLGGAHRLSAPLAGALSALCAVTQKVLTQILLYGAPIVELYAELLQRGSKTLGLSRSHGLGLVLGFVLLLVLIGAAFGAFGLRAGRAATARHAREGDDDAAQAARALHAAPASSTSPRHALTTRPRAGLCAALAVASLVALAWTPRIVHPALGLALTLGAWLAAPKLLRACGRPRSWLFAAALLMCMGALLDKDAQQLWSWPGALLASTMLTRALALVLCCQALLACLPAPKPRDSALRRAVAAALAAVPAASQALRRSLQTARDAGIRAPHRLLAAVLHEAVWLASCAARSARRASEFPAVTRSDLD